MPLREHHYQFSHTFLPQQVQSTPEVLLRNLSGPKATLFLKFLWDEVGKQVNTPDGAAGFELRVLGADERAGWQLVLLKMPQPRSAGESIAAVLARKGSTVRYFVLDAATTPGFGAMAEYSAVGRIAYDLVPGGGPGAFLRAVGQELGFDVSASDVAALDRDKPTKSKAGLVVGVVAGVSLFLVVALVATCVGGRMLLRARGDDTSGTSAPAAAREPAGPGVFFTSGAGGVLGVEDAKAKRVDQSYVTSAITSTKSGFYFLNSSGGFYSYDGSKTALAELPGRDFELVSEMRDGHVIAKTRSDLAIFDGKRWETLDIATLTGTSSRFGKIEDVLVSGNDRLIVAVADDTGRGYLAEWQAGGSWSRVPFPDLPAGARMKSVVSASVMQARDGLFLRFNESLYKKAGSGFERVSSADSLSYRPLLTVGDGTLLAIGNQGKSERTVLYLCDAGRLKVIKRYSGGQQVWHAVRGQDGNVYVIVTEPKKDNSLDKVTSAGAVASALKSGQTIGSNAELTTDAHGRVWTWTKLSDAEQHVLEKGELRAFSTIIDDIVFTNGGPVELPASFAELVRASSARR